MGSFYSYYSVDTTQMENKTSTVFSHVGGLPYLTEEKLIAMIDECNSCKNYSNLVTTLDVVYSNIRSLSLSFQKTGSCPKKEMRMGLDYSSMKRAYSALFKLPQYIFENAVGKAITTLARYLEMEMQDRDEKLYSNEEIVDVFLVVFEVQTFRSGDFLKLGLPKLCNAAKWMTQEVQFNLAKAWADQGASTIRTILENLHKLIEFRVVHSSAKLSLQDDQVVTAATRVMKILYYANILIGASPGAVQLAFNEFINEALSDSIDMVKDISIYRTSITNFSFMRYSFILKPEIKTLCLHYDNIIRMHSEKLKCLWDTYEIEDPTLYLLVRREHIIEDTLESLGLAIFDDPLNLRKQLVIDFEDEEGVDEGGLSKEFFQIIVDEIFKHDYGMFTLQNDSQTMWFNSTSLVDENHFTLIGIILGLAIYNSVILSINFPMVLYKKLKGNTGSFQDLSEWNPTLYNSLKQLLEYTEDDMEDVFMQTFRVSYKDMFGNLMHHDLIKNGDEIVVNQQNKHEFVKKYTDFLLNKSVDKQFQAFYRGFHMVADETLFDLLFRPDEVELLICGSKNFNFNELEDTVEYESYTEFTPIIIHFWSVIREFTFEEQRQFLQFTTGSDRVPIAGLSTLNMRIVRNGPDTDFLPSSFTCYNTLLLPEYCSKEKLRNRLLTAMKHSRGFGMP